MYFVNMCIDLYNHIFIKKNKVECENCVEQNNKNKKEIINRINDIYILNEKHIDNVKKLSHDSLVDLIMCYNNNNSYVIDIIYEMGEKYENEKYKLIKEKYLKNKSI